MTIQAVILLNKLRKAQRTLDGCVYIDEKSMIVETVREGDQKSVRVNIGGYRNSLKSTLAYLADRDLITGRMPYYKVRSIGWHWKQELFYKILQFVAKSIIVPVMVSLATTLTTMWITGYFS